MPSTTVRLAVILCLVCLVTGALIGHALMPRDLATLVNR